MKKTLAIVLFFYSITGYSLSFERLRYDQYVPGHCQDMSVSNFNINQIQIFSVSVTGGLERGFTFEYPMTRESARVLYHAFKNGNTHRKEFQERLKRDPAFNRDYQVILQNAGNRGFNFTSEGEVLEVLVLSRIQTNLTLWNSGLYVSGSVRYKGRSSGGNAGELDVVIADIMSCEIIGYGEAKLGVHRIGKAHDQIQRFSRNLSSAGVIHQLIAPTVNYLN